MPMLFFIILLFTNGLQLETRIMSASEQTQMGETDASETDAGMQIKCIMMERKTKQFIFSIFIPFSKTNIATRPFFAISVKN